MKYLSICQFFCPLGKRKPNHEENIITRDLEVEKKEFLR